MYPELWTVDEVWAFLEKHNFKQYAKLLCEENKIDGKRLLCLTENDLQKQPLKIVTFGDRRRLWFLIDNLQEEKRLFNKRMGYSIEQHMHSKVNKNIVDNILRHARVVSPKSKLPPIHNENDTSRNLKTKPGKFVLAAIYLLSAIFFSGYAAIYAQQHLPDKKKYPPLPDVFLDYLPQIPWAYKMTEGVLHVLIITGLIMLFFHKYRFLVLQRLMIVSGYIYYFRSFCVMSTSIPMPQKQYDCDRLELKDSWARLRLNVQFFFAIGMKTNGIKTCGDYIFSGHTVMITLLVLSINEYSPSRMTYLHVLTWIIGFTGAFFILLGHGHYTVDIVLAFAISSKLFAAHHTFANNLSLMANDTFRMKVCFPLFYYYEWERNGFIPNEYEWPLPGFMKMQTTFYDIKRALSKLCYVRLKSSKYVFLIYLIVLLYFIFIFIFLFKFSLE